MQVLARPSRSIPSAAEHHRGPAGPVPHSEEMSQTSSETDKSDELVDTKVRDLQPRICMLPADGDGFDYPFRYVVDGFDSICVGFPPPWTSDSESERVCCRSSDLNIVESSIEKDEEGYDPRYCEYCQGYYCAHFISRQMPGQPMLDPGDFPLNIRHWIWAESGKNDELPWRLLCQLDDGNFAFYMAHCGYTGCACAST
jgi:hypothetical protein